MYSFILEATRILKIWSEYIFRKKTETTVSTSTPKYNTRHLRNLPKLIHLPAYKGNADEQNNFGNLYCSIENYKLAFHWYRLAAMQGHVNAQVVLGMFYDRGEDIVQNCEEAAKWFKRAAEQGDASGQYRFSRMLVLGRGIERNFKEGFRW